MKIPISILAFLAMTTIAAPTSNNALLQIRDSSSIVPSQSDPNFIDAVMRAHWYWRRWHCAQDMTWDSSLADAAQADVNKCDKDATHVSPFLSFPNPVHPPFPQYHLLPQPLTHSSPTHHLQTPQYRAGSNLDSMGPAPSSYNDWIEFARTGSHGWHDEERLYPYDNPHYDNSWGHFTQMVWRDTSRIGCAMADCSGEGVGFPGRLYCCKSLFFSFSCLFHSHFFFLFLPPLLCHG